MTKRLAVVRRRCLIGGGLALAVSAAGAWLAPDAFFRAYLIGFLFWSGIALGSLAVLCLHQFVGGEWGFVIRRLLEASSRTILWLPLFFAPVLLGLSRLYPWTGTNETSYLSTDFFLVRAAIYLTAWVVFAHQLNRLSREQERGERSWVNRLQTLGAVGMLVYALTITFASVDWVMSLEPDWHSTVYGLGFMVGQALAAFAFVIPMLSRLSRFEPMASRVRESHFHDLGNLLLAFVLLWAYLAFSQYLIIWSGNIPDEISWYLHRLRGGWSFVGLAIIVFHFVVPFFLLLFRHLKQRRKLLSRVALAILAARWIDLFWLVTPASRERLGIHWMDLTVSLGLGGLWLFLFLREVEALPLLASKDPRFTPRAIDGGAHEPA